MTYFGKHSNLIRFYLVTQGTERARHPVIKPFNVSAEQWEEATEIPYEWCELEIDLQTGKSRTCEHNVAFKWEEK